MANDNLSNAKSAKNDEFYTQYADIEKEMNAYLEFDPDVFRGKTVLLPCDDPEWSNFTRYFAQNFERIGLKKLTGTSYAPAAAARGQGPTPLETASSQFDAAKSTVNGKIFTITRDVTGDDRTDVRDLEWAYLEGDGDFRSREVTRLRDEADIVVTNPPFSLFREFLSWITEADKQFVIIGNMNAITYKEAFTLIQADRMWLGNGFQSGNAYFRPLAVDRDFASGVFDAETGLVKFRNVVWFTNLDHGRRHRPLALMTMAENLRFSKHKGIKGRSAYAMYDNYDAIDVPFTDAIPSDYPALMGVPISFLDKYSAEQFEIVGASDNGAVVELYKLPHFKKHNEPFIDGVKRYKRIFIRHRRAAA
jgi:hypothetical protein